MGSKQFCLLFSILMVSAVSANFDMSMELPQDKWTLRTDNKRNDEEGICIKIKPTPKNIVKRFYAILPFFDREHSNAAFLHKFRGTVYGMSEGDDPLDREAAFYASVLAPMVFLQNYRDTWCLMERFHRAMRLYQISHPTEKRQALKSLQSLRSVNLKMRSFIDDLTGAGDKPPKPPASSLSENNHDKKDVKFLNELIKNLG